MKKKYFFAISILLMGFFSIKSNKFYAKNVIDNISEHTCYLHPEAGGNFVLFPCDDCVQRKIYLADESPTSKCTKN